eukprot:scaffold112436_cov49-Prasinocladus_malaysianus.AAC.1
MAARRPRKHGSLPRAREPQRSVGAFSAYALSWLLLLLLACAQKATAFQESGTPHPGQERLNAAEKIAAIGV